MKNGEKLVKHADGYFFVDPKPTPEALRKFYNDKYYAAQDGRNQYAHGYSEEELVHKRLSAAEAEHVVGRKSGRLLEVGVGEGFVLDWFIERGWDASGIDFTRDGIERYFPQHAYKVTTGDAFELLDARIESGAVYDFVICNNVLEHVIDPERLLDRLRRIVAPGGLARIAVPNDGGWLHQELVARDWVKPNFWVVTPDHLSYFDVDSLPRALRSHGWDVVDLLAEMPIDMFLLNPATRYTDDPKLGRACHAARLAFETGMWQRRSIEAVIEFRRGCARGGVGRNLTAYARPIG